MYIESADHIKVDLTPHKLTTRGPGWRSSSFKTSRKRTLKRLRDQSRSMWAITGERVHGEGALSRTEREESVMMPPHRAGCASPSVVATAANSSATISLGKLGRVELMPNSSVKLSFSDNNISSTLDAGRVQIATLAGSSAIVTTKDGSVVADASQAASFTVDVECGNTIVASQAGMVELRGAGTAKTIAAGTSESAGQAQPGSRCTRLTRTDTFGHLHGGALAALLLAAGGAVAAAIWAATRNNDLNFGGSVVVISPTK